MGSCGTVPLSSIWKMLADCALGYTKTETDHHWIIRYGEFEHRGFPLGDHGRRKTPRIQIGHVRKLARKLDIQQCAAKHLAQLR